MRLSELCEQAGVELLPAFGQVEHVAVVDLLELGLVLARLLGAVVEVVLEALLEMLVRQNIDPG